MPTRICDACGKKKELSGGRTCEKGHFICKSCVGSLGIIFDNRRTTCPICHTKLK